MTIDFAISTEAIKKAEMYEKRRIDLDFCLQAKICPICAEKLVTEIDGNRNTEYKCIKCDFIWPQKLEKNTINKTQIMDKNKVGPTIIKEALADGKICKDKRGGCDNWDCNSESEGSYALRLDRTLGYSEKYSEDTYCEKCIIELLNQNK